METPGVRAYAGGFAAYDAWAAALLRESEFPTGAPLPMLMERLMCQVDAMTVVGERWYAAAFLEKAAEAFPAAAPNLAAAAACFRREHKLVREMACLLGGYGMGEKQARNLAKPEVRRELAALIEECAEADREAAGHIGEALGTI